jgi:predicted GIY-YIG superfamily endonuclease
LTFLAVFSGIQTKRGALVSDETQRTILKTRSRQKKIAVIAAMNPEWRDLCDDL